ncbi:MULTISPECIES: DUF2935 domain-containing protein [Clostridium]|jgi:Domain of unknown function (DUF2935)|uniref:DUF2935 domain-containing protein n=1 Tax=Clostridium sartagoforme AAU1 TaxID=1202534 RepID=R9CKG9_9CLOT|nr:MULTISPECIES: DUF2935 domain-containing protein [Clostridium]EOR27681.1 hypothetical protein A500_03126 [Clostridium sartagoforme AAU1]KLE15798.1 hypothetical protein AAT22_09655 [Clostridium sp. C8]
MLSREKYVDLSLELHLFYTKIMRDHAIFLEAGFPQKNTKLSKEADEYKVQFEKYLIDIIKLSKGIVKEDILESKELYTEYTLNAENKTQYYTGIEINPKITDMQSKIKSKNNEINERTINNIRKFNSRVIKLLDDFIDFKSRILDEILSCMLFSSNYPTFVEHLIHEAKLYRSYIYSIENNEDIKEKNIKETQLFWNHIMMEHALFIRGLLDPSEGNLINSSNNFVKIYNDLIEEAKHMNESSILDLTENTLKETKKLRDFKEAGVEGIEECKIKSIILPLLADHVLREANHYIRLLKKYENKRLK